MPQSKHVFFDTNGTKEVYFDDQARWALAPDIKGEHGVMLMQPVGATDLPPNSLAPIEDFDPIGEPLQLFFKKPESIDSLIDALVKLRSMMAYEQTNTKAKKGCDCPDCQAVEEQVQTEEQKEDLLFDGIELEEAAKFCISIGMSPKEYLQRRAKELGLDFKEVVTKKFGECGCPTCQQNLAQLTGDRDIPKEILESLKKGMPKDLAEALAKAADGIEVEVIRVPKGEMPKELADFLSSLTKK